MKLATPLICKCAAVSYTHAAACTAETVYAFVFIGSECGSLGTNSRKLFSRVLEARRPG